MEKRVSNRLPEQFRRDEIPGNRLTPGPYVGIVKNNVDPAFRGRLQVWIPDLGGDENDQSHWRTVNYASPYFGSTHQVTATDKNEFGTTSHSYGMWMVPPDIGNWVLVTFAAGNVNQGFWFACIPSTVSHHMVPAIGSTSKIEQGTNDGIEAEQFPVVEFNDRNESLNWANFRGVAKPVHKKQLDILVNQGLEQDTIRGTITSSSQRETPSHVFGISTPGRVYENKTALGKDPAAAKTSIEKTVNMRDGGHTFVMDDGDKAGKNQLIRLRTAGGHQILMHDSETTKNKSEQTIYVAHSDGLSWVELAADGKVYVYAKEEINFRTNYFNVHADQSINFYAGNEINMLAKLHFNVSTKTLDMLSSANTTIYANGSNNIGASGQLIASGSNIHLNTSKVSPPAGIPVTSKPETVKQGKQYKSSNGALNTSLPVPPPTHEPYSLHITTAGATGTKTTTKKPAEQQPPAAPRPPKPATPSTAKPSTDAAKYSESGTYEQKTTALIMKEEGLPKGGKAYDLEGKGIYTIGYGHQINQQDIANGYLQCGDEKVPLKGVNGSETVLSKEQSAKLLEGDLPKYTARAKGPMGEEAWSKLNDNQKAALTSYTYNVGSTSNLVKAGLRDQVLAGDMSGAAQTINDKGYKTASIHGVRQTVPALVNRRATESKLFMA